jgi:hypothetical protein
MMAQIALQLNWQSEKFVSQISDAYPDGWRGPSYEVDESGRGYYVMHMPSRRDDVPDLCIAGHKMGVVLAQAVCCLGYEDDEKDFWDYIEQHKKQAGQLGENGEQE